jgi:hypothetical protein
LETDDEAEVPIRKQKAKSLTFEKNESGEFILPEKAGVVKDRQRMIRGYIGAVYSQ